MSSSGADRPVLVVDNFDSFVYNLVQYLGQLGVRCIVRRNDAVTVEELPDLGVAGVLLSPGPGTPADAGVTVPMVRAAAAAGTPVFGVCLGHQGIGHVYGASVVRAPELMHGKTSVIRHQGQGFGDRERIVAVHQRVCADLAEVLHEVVDEAVVAVEDEDAGHVRQPAR